LWLKTKTPLAAGVREQAAWGKFIAPFFSERAA
jgi:hypothetical protein